MSDTKETIKALIARVEALTEENAKLRAAARSTEYRKRPPVMRGRTVQANAGCGPLYITLNEDEDGRPFEVFFKLGKSGSCQQSYLEALGVAMSVGLRYGADPQKFVQKFEGMRCPNPRMRDASGPSTLSCADGISQGLARALMIAVEARDADTLAVAEPQFPYPEADLHEHEANAKSIDLIDGAYNGNGHGNGGGSSVGAAVATRRKAMQTGVGMCPKCGGNLISQGGCIQCLAQCGYVGKCS
jgi:ribonucleoside-diphosphate reductase alpha chain